MATKKDAKALAEATMDAVNQFGFDEKAYAEVVANNHPTLQQNWMRMAMETIAALAKKADTGRYDGRNEATVMLAKEIARLAESVALPLI